jgi:hypothetical protein
MNTGDGIEVKAISVAARRGKEKIINITLIMIINNLY